MRELQPVELKMSDGQLRDYLTIELFKAIRKGCGGGKYTDIMSTANAVYNRMKEEQKGENSV